MNPLPKLMEASIKAIKIKEVRKASEGLRRGSRHGGHEESPIDEDLREVLKISGWVR